LRKLLYAIPLITLFILSIIGVYAQPNPANYIAVLVDDSTDDPFLYTKSFTEVSSGVIQVETDIIVTDYGGGQGAGIKILTADTSRIALYLYYDGSTYEFLLKNVDGGNSYYFGSAELNKWYRFKLSYNFSNSVCEAIIEDETGQIAYQNFTASFDKFDTVGLTGFGTAGTGTAKFDNVAVYIDGSLVLEDDFDDGDASDWTTTMGTHALSVEEYGSGSTEAIEILFIDPGDSYTISINGSVLDYYGVNVTVDGNNLTITVDDISSPFGWVETNYTMYIIFKINLTKHDEIVLASPEDTGDGWWAGGDIYYINNTFHVLVRYRSPTDRGYKLVWYKGNSLDNLTVYNTFIDSDYGYESFEHATLDENLTLYYCADDGSGWDIYKGLPGSSTLYINGSKDPFIEDGYISWTVVGVGSKYATYPGLANETQFTDFPYIHGKIYKVGSILIGLNDHRTGDTGVGVYGGVGYSKDGVNWVWKNDFFQSPYGSGTFRYIGVLSTGNEVIFYAEKEYSDGSLYFIYYSTSIASSGNESNEGSSGSSGSGSVALDTTIIYVFLPVIIMLMAVSMVINMLQRAFRW